jgi:hypothetical protein
MTGKFPRARADSSAQGRIKEIEDEIHRTQYNKATQKHIGMLKARLARLRQQEAGQEIGGGKRGLGFGIRKAGDATVLLMGLPSVGKSTLLNALTNAGSPIGEYDFTTLRVIPGMMLYNGARIQLLDVPGLITGAASGRGRGRETLSMARAADLICLILDATKDYAGQLEIIAKELHEAGFRLNQAPPDIRLCRRERGGISITRAAKGKSLPDDTIKEVLREFGILNAELVLRQGITLDQFVDFLAGNRAYVPFMAVVNKADMLKEGRRGPDSLVFISAKTGLNLGALRQIIWGKLGLMRVYLKRTGHGPDMEEPLVIKGNARVADVARRIHKDLGRRLFSARIWGPSARFPGQSVGPSHRLKDGDVVEMHLK